jgi:hypothetical protein
MLWYHLDSTTVVGTTRISLLRRVGTSGYGAELLFSTRSVACVHGVRDGALVGHLEAFSHQADT